MSEGVTWIRFGVTAAALSAYMGSLALTTNTSPSSTQVDATIIPAASAMLCSAMTARGIDFLSADPTGDLRLKCAEWVSKKAVYEIGMARQNADTSILKARRDELREIWESIFTHTAAFAGASEPPNGPHIMTSHVQGAARIRAAVDRMGLAQRLAWRGRV